MISTTYYNGVYVAGSAGVVNTGTIDGQNGIVVAGATPSGGATGSVDNSGLIQAVSTFGLNQGGVYSGAGIALTEAGTVTNSGSITASNAGIVTDSRLAVVQNLAGGTIISGNTSVYSSIESSNYGVDMLAGGSLDNAGLITGYNAGAQLYGGTLTNLESGTITGYFAAVDTVDGVSLQNAGLISGSDSGINADHGTLHIANLAGGTITATYAGMNGRYGGFGVIMYDGTLHNAGLISGGAQGGGGVKLGGVNQQQVVATVSNAVTGTISGGAGVFGYEGTVINDGGIDGGVNFSAGGQVTNTGVIYATSRYGVRLSGASAKVINSGSIEGPSSSYGGVSLSDGGTINNSNFIGGYARITGAPGTIINTGTMTGAYVSKGGTIENQVNGMITSRTSESDAKIVNAGTIGGFGVSAYNGVVTNLAGAKITGVGQYSYGASLFGTVKMTNAGNVSGGRFGVHLLTANASFTNLAGGNVYGGTHGAYGYGNVVNAGQIGGGNDGVFALGSNVTNEAGGVITSKGVGVVIAYGVGTLTNAGTIAGGSDAVEFRGGYADRLIVDPGAVFTGGVIGTSGTTTLELAGRAAGTLAGIGTQFTNFGSILFDTGAQWRLEGDVTGLANQQTISGFAVGDTIVLDGETDSAPTYVAGTGLELFDGSGYVTVDIAGSFSTSSFMVTDVGGNTEIVICYLRGTRLLTPSGQINVEDLRIGDTLVTRFKGVRPIKWIGRQSFAARFVKNNLDRTPVCIRTHALGNNLPARDLYVSPGHSMLLNDTLVLAKSMVNGITVTQNDIPDEIHYYQVEFESHDCVLAEGAWSETYADSWGMRAAFQNAAEFHALYPDDPSPEHPQLCAARPQSGLALDAVLRPIVMRAYALAGGKLGPLRGWIDRISKDYIGGWAQNHDYPDLPVLLEVVSAGQVVSTVLACDPREDLAEIGRGLCSFAFKLSAALLQEKLELVEIRRASDGSALPYTYELRASLPSFSGRHQAA